MTSAALQHSPSARQPISGSLEDDEPPFWRRFVAGFVDCAKWAYGGTFLVGIAYYTLRLFQWLWSSGNFVGFAGAFALLAGTLYGSYRLWRARRTSVSSATSAPQAGHSS